MYRRPPAWWRIPIRNRNGRRHSTRRARCCARRRSRRARRDRRAMVLMIDNYDSFTYNLVQYLAELGAEVRVVRNDEITVDEARSLAPRAIVISPGPSAPERAGISLQIIQRLAGRVPILGVCLGH